MKNGKFILTLALCAVAVLAGSTVSYAAVTPTAGQLGYGFYDLVINQGLRGPIGMTIAGSLIAAGGYNLHSEGSIKASAYAMIGGAAIIMANVIMASVPGAMLY